MEAELENKTLQIVTWLEQTIKSTADFTAEQVPLFIHELLLYNFTMSLTAFITGIILLIATIWSGLKFIKWTSKYEHTEYQPAIMFWFLPLMLGIAMVVGSTDWLMIKLAPRVYLMEYVRDMVK